MLSITYKIDILKIINFCPEQSREDVITNKWQNDVNYDTKFIEVHRHTLSRTVLDPSCFLGDSFQ